MELRPGDVVLARYMGVGERLHDERRATGGVDPSGLVAQLTAGGDHYVEDFALARNLDVLLDAPRRVSTRRTSRGASSTASTRHLRRQSGTG